MTTGGMARDPGVSSDGRTELKRVVSHIEVLSTRGEVSPTRLNTAKTRQTH